MRRQEIQTVLDAAGSGPKHHFGQNFMMDESMLAAIMAEADITPADTILEVGPGPGNLTSLLARRAAAVLAVDVDQPLLRAASGYWSAEKNIRWLCADVLAGKHQVNPVVIRELNRLVQEHMSCRSSVKLVSNLPYNVASPLVAELLVLQCLTGPIATIDGAPGFHLERMVFTVQWEVAQRMAATPGTADYGGLGVLIQLLARVEVLRSIAPGCFWPPPKIRSALVRITPDHDLMIKVAHVRWLQIVITRLFSHRRQNLANALRHGFKNLSFPALSAAATGVGCDLRARAETLPPERLRQLADALWNVDGAADSMRRITGEQEKDRPSSESIFH